MKKLSMYILVLLLSATVFLLGFQDKNTIVPNYLYKVYLDDEVLGVIKSKKELENYIDTEGTHIKEQYGVDKVYAPNGLQIKRIITYSDEIDSVKDVYEKLKEMKPFTINGYQFTIKRSEEEKIIIYVKTKELFEKAIESTIRTYVGIEEYENYKSNNQKEIETVGTIIDRIYIDELVTVKEYKIPVNEEIFVDEKTLSKYMLFGTIEEGEKYIVKVGDTIKKIAESHKMGVEAILISNSELSSVDNILYAGQELSLAVPKTAVTVVAEYTQVEEVESSYLTEEKPDPTMNIGDEEIIQKGENGKDRLTSVIKKINGNIDYAKVNKRVIIEPSINQVVLVGSRYQSNIGSTQWWRWPTQSYPRTNISTYFGYRNHPIYGYYQYHAGIDTYYSYGTPIYAANNGTIVEMNYNPPRSENKNSTGYGWYILINHNNGYMSLYAHMVYMAYPRGLKVGSVVSRGQIIGYMGQTGDATGPHLHFEIWRNGERTNPLNYSYR